jgi:hypothetical protein
MVNNHRPWSEADVEALIASYSRRKWWSKAAAIKLGRTPSATRAKAYSIGLIRRGKPGIRPMTIHCDDEGLRKAAFDRAAGFGLSLSRYVLGLIAEDVGHA